MAEIKCPMCSKPNPEDLDVCQFCEARLKPLTDKLSRSQPPIQPGAKPTPIDTGELEPVLPQWLREVRQKARDSAEDDKEQGPAEEGAIQPEESFDLLAGLQSNAEDDEEIPDWLTGLRGEVGQARSEESSSEDDDLTVMESVLDEETLASQESDTSSLPGWVSDLSDIKEDKQVADDELSAFLADATKEASPQIESQPSATDTDLERAFDFRPVSAPEKDFADKELLMDADLPGWLQGANKKPESETGIDLSARMEDDLSTQISPAIESDEALQTSTDEGETYDWLSSLGEESTEAPMQQESAQSDVEGDLPDWMSSPSGESVEGHAQQQESDRSPTESDKPDWMSSLDEESVSAQSREPASGAAFLDDESQSAVEGETPDWLASLGEKSDQADTQKEPAQIAADGETPDWLLSLDGETSKAERPAEQVEAPAFIIDEPTVKNSAQSASVDGDGTPLSKEDVDAIFSIDMPDWLSDTGGQTSDATPAVTEHAMAGDLDPANLPSWVQAMRPVEAVISEISGEDLSNQPLEKIGPLAGLRGVLPAVPGVGPSSKPKAYSIKLQASDEQQAGAIILEQILTEEIYPKPIVNQNIIFSHRILRWLIAGFLVLVVGATSYFGTEINPIPTTVQPETSAALRHIQEVLPNDAQVLLIFDYEAALVGEMEATAVPLVDYMLTLKHPRLCLISSTPTGTGLAERLMGKLLPDHDYSRGENFINLGFLPGGAAGVLSFVVRPADTKPLSTTGENPWETPVLQGISSLSNFAAIILLTDDVETARIWIEQTESVHASTQFLVVSSAQSGPMILPYVQSGQVDGMITGLDSSAPIEQVNSGRPGMVRRYWDAYGFGLLTAAAMISFGSLWSLIAGWQERRKERGEG